MGRLPGYLFTRPAQVRGETPVGAGTRGAAAGLAATLVLSALVRLLPGMRPSLPFLRRPPDPPREPDEVCAWQAREQAPAAHRQREGARERGARLVAGTPAAALAQPTAPGPEGLAEQFAFKIASGVFDRDISPYLRPAGLAVHLAYGSAWGALYGLLQASYRRPPATAGAGYGVVVWLVGPATLVPAMRLMGRPDQEPLLRTTAMLAAHVAYGLTLAGTFEALEREAT